MKIKWTMGEKPTGRYRSFQHRAWPSAEYEDGKPAVMLYAVEDEHKSYRPSIKETATLRLRVADYHDNTFTWVGLVFRPVGLTTAKRVARDWIRAYGEKARDPNRRLR